MKDTTLKNVGYAVPRGTYFLSSNKNDKVEETVDLGSVEIGIGFFDQPDEPSLEEKAKQRKEERRREYFYLLSLPTSMLVSMLEQRITKGHVNDYKKYELVDRIIHEREISTRGTTISLRT